MLKKHDAYCHKSVFVMRKVAIKITAKTRKSSWFMPQEINVMITGPPHRVKRVIHGTSN